MKNNNYNKIYITFGLFFLITFFGALNISHAANHDFTGLPLTADGWTDIEAMVQEDSRIIYVSTSGNDTTGIYNLPADQALIGEYSVLEPNESQINPYQTLAAGYTQLRNGYPDFLLLKRGESWSSEGLND